MILPVSDVRLDMCCSQNSRLPQRMMMGGAKRNNRDIQTGVCERSTGLAKDGTLWVCHCGVEMSSELIFTRFSKSATMRNLFQSA